MAYTKLVKQRFSKTHKIPARVALNKSPFFFSYATITHTESNSVSPPAPAFYVIFISSNSYQGSYLLFLFMFAFMIAGKPDLDLHL